MSGSVHDYLRSKGLQSTSDNVRRALTENARNPGLIPGLTNQEPPPPDAANPRASGPGVGQKGSAASRIEGGNGGGQLPVPPIPSQSAANQTTGSGTKTTSAAPQYDDPSHNTSGLDWSTILGIGAGGGAGAFGSRMMGPSGGGAEFMGNVQAPMHASTLPPSALGAPQDALMLGGGQSPLIAGDPMQAALSKAIGQTGSPAASLATPPATPPAAPPMPQIGNAGGSGGAVVPSTAIPMPDQTSGPTIIPPNEASGPTIAPPRTEPPRAPPTQTPGLMEDFARFVRGIGARR